MQGLTGIGAGEKAREDYEPRAGQTLPGRASPGRTGSGSPLFIYCAPLAKPWAAARPWWERASWLRWPRKRAVVSGAISTEKMRIGYSVTLL